MKKTLYVLCTSLALGLMCIFFALEIKADDGDLDDTAVFFWREKEAEVPIIMYHLVTEKQKYLGKYGITPAELEADLHYLKDNGYKTVVMADLIDFVQSGKKLPKKPIVLTFDDGNVGDFDYVLPLLERYKMKAVFSVIGEAADKYTLEREKHPKAKYPNLTWGEIKIMHDSGWCEIQSHGYNLHGRNGAGIRRNECADAYYNRLYEDLHTLQKRCHEEIGFTPTTFTYPLGVISKGSREVLEELGFVASLSCQEGMNLLKQGDRHCLFRLNRVNRPSGKPIKFLLDKIEK
ncbi:MAG: polysaccharide deacetylase family protein [Defluviitaleaceae bacterium]|nr:polysaccharide deacetylase family protein [Defluviitaleaceae bacterium]MCL2239612.1 polysaccharide deacetylase family protein [Defluviitaleaceae bacterium]